MQTTPPAIRTMRAILGGKPSRAIRAMCDGLQAQAKRPDFRILMDTFGSHIRGVCYGCAATCAVQEAAGIQFGPENITGNLRRSSAIGCDRHDLAEFEAVVERLRNGNLISLGDYFGADLSRWNLDSRMALLGTNNWRDRIDGYYDVAEEMEREGL